MFCFRLLLCIIGLNVLHRHSSRCLAMSFTAQYDNLNKRNIALIAPTPFPLESGAVNEITGLTAGASIQIKQPKPKHIDKLQTVLLNITLLATSVTIKWKFWVIKKNRIKRSGAVASVQPERRSLEWVIKMRQYSTLNVNIYHVKDDNNSLDDLQVHNKTYNYTIRGLQPLTAYELCVHSNHAISDSLSSFVNTYQRNYDICKEIITIGSDDRVAEITMASAISSASTTVVIVVMFCCCRRGNDKTVSERSKSINRRHKNRRKNFKYQRIWKWLDRSPQTSYQTSTLSATNSKLQANRPILNPVVNSHEFYINPEDIKCITGKNIRVFTKNSKPLNPSVTYVPKIRNNISTTSMFRKRYARPNSWPLIDTNRTWLKTQSNPSIFSSARSNKLWFHSLSSDVNITTSLSNEEFV